MFLDTVGRHAAIRAAMASAGYGPEDHTEGLRLLGAVCVYGGRGLDPRVDVPAREATRALVDWASANWVRLRMALERLHPAAAPLFAELDPRDSPRVVLAVATLLKALAALAVEEQSEQSAGSGRRERCEWREQSRQSSVLDTLARRGFDAAARARLALLVETAQGVQAPVVTNGSASTESCRDEALVALCWWFRDWSATAKAVVKRKDWRLQLGLVRRHVARPREAG
jgi:hypothetical protein